MKLQGELIKLNKLNGTCEICKKPAQDLYLKDLYAGHKDCLASDIDPVKVSQNIIEINRDFATKHSC